ncbi:MAG: GTP-binding protein YchF [Chthonomonadaceae bacterium]|nr:GTP-binding protein YchF [Chthonomonadaceae bacterium]
MKVGIIGLPQTGKTSLYNALTRSAVELNRFGGAEVNVGVIGVPDPRFDYAVAQCAPKKISPASIEFTEGGARIERAERQGAGDKFGTDFFSAVRNMDTLILVVRAFDDPTVTIPEGGINAKREAEQINEELMLADLTVIEGRLEKLEKSRLQKRQTNAEAAEHMVLNKIKAHLDELNPVRSLHLPEDEARSVKSYAFVSGKPLILVANVGENDAGSDAPAGLEPLAEYAKDLGVPLVSMCAKIEMEVAQMEPDEEREFLEAMGIHEAARDRLIRAAYSALGLICFFTVGEDEVRAWTITKGTNAVGAAGAIHSDLARGFIRAELVDFEEFRAAGGCWDAAKSAGKMRLEGKEYIVKDGDILHVRFKV